MTIHPFHWVPAQDQRHASLDRRPGGGYPTGMSVRTLCDQQLTAENTELAWLWLTCPDCNIEAHRLANVPFPLINDQASERRSSGQPTRKRFKIS
ncbi:zinc finger protein [Saccharopolyspora sp. 5N708]|uniref:zinc finger protein n=1 Tax=Saccharopolyspora sp. 5N708 TaxID=3457424 RepID=UPI003FD039B3